MRTGLMIVAAALLTATAANAASLFKTPARSTWTVTKNGSAAGKLELSSSGAMARADWAPATGNAHTTIARDGKLWLRTDDGDVDLTASKEPVASFVPALLLPATTSSRDKVSESAGRVSTYTFGSASASYTWDAEGPSKVDVKSGSTSWTLQRTAIRKGAVPIATFEVQPKQSRGGRLASMAGNLLGPSNREASTTAGVSGVDPKGIKLADGGDWTALAEAEAMNDEFTSDARQLESFQKSGKVGSAGGNR